MEFTEEGVPTKANRDDAWAHKRLGTVLTKIKATGIHAGLRKLKILNPGEQVYVMLYLDYPKKEQPKKYPEGVYYVTNDRLERMTVAIPAHLIQILPKEDDKCQMNNRNNVRKNKILSIS